MKKKKKTFFLFLLNSKTKHTWLSHNNIPNTHSDSQPLQDPQVHNVRPQH